MNNPNNKEVPESLFIFSNLWMPLYANEHPVDEMVNNKTAYEEINAA